MTSEETIKVDKYTPELEETEGGKIYSIEISQIQPNPNQPRKVFSEESIIKLADSIQQYGIIQPLTVKKSANGYELIAGERRLRACIELGLPRVPCIIINASEEKSAELSIIENLLREDLNIFEQALAIETLIDTYGSTQEQVAKKLSTSQSFIANKLRLLRLGEKERDIILSNKLTERHARAVLRIPNQEERIKILEKIAQDGLNVAKTEDFIENITRQTADKPKHQASYKDISAFYSALNRVLDGVKNSNFKIKSRKIESEDYTELTILIPKSESELIEAE